MTLRYEVLTLAGAWRAIPFAELVVGMVFRAFGGDGQPVVDEHGARKWRVLGRTAAGELEAETEPETAVEAEVRARGAYWPSGPPRPETQGWAPSRLR